MTRSQMLALGFTPQAIKHRIWNGRLHPIWRGVYAVGRPEVSRHGRWMAAVLSCGPDAVLSHASAAALWGIRGNHSEQVEVSVASERRRPGIVVHRRSVLEAGHITRRHGIPLTDPVCTLVDLAARLSVDAVEAAVNEADKRDLVGPDALRAALGSHGHWQGVARLEKILDRRTFTLTDSRLERHFLPLARAAGLPQPRTGKHVNGCKVDFYWPDLGLVVETDGLRYHRTPAQQTRDRVRDQAHAAAGLTPVRFTRAQVVFEPGHVQLTLAAVARGLRGGRR